MLNPFQLEYSVERETYIVRGSGIYNSLELGNIPEIYTKNIVRQMARVFHRGKKERSKEISNLLNNKV